MPEEWRATRRFLNGQRPDLTARAARLYAAAPRVGPTLLLTDPAWWPDRPLPLEAVTLGWDAGAPRAALTGREPESAGVRPAGFATYAEAVGDLDRPDLFENRFAYRLVEVDLAAAGRLTFTRGAYFDAIDVAEAMAHELAARVRAGAPVEWAHLPLRALVGDPFDLARRPQPVALCALTLRHDARAGTASFVLHWRDPRRVASGGGLYQVMPVGVFQPAADTAEDEADDLDLWRGLVREYAEEYLGAPERGRGAYHDWPFYRAMTAARDAGRVRVHCFGVGLDPLTLAADLVLAVVCDAEVFDELFAARVDANEEGTVLTAGDGRGFPFSEPVIEEFVSGRLMQPAGAAALAQAWRHRDVLLGAQARS
jgi:hypothetical protein